LHVIVDEFQDLTPGEQQLMFRLRRDDGQLVALGDPRQSIYAFRGNDREGLHKLDRLAEEWGNATIVDVPLNECQRCPADVVHAANRLMGLAAAQAMTPASSVASNLHLVTWPDPHVEADGMARAIVQNVRAHPEARHLVMVSRRRFGFWLRDRIAALDAGFRVELSFSEGLLETWAVREAFLFFCLLVDPDGPTWRAWLAYSNSTTGDDYKSARRNAAAYLRLLGSARDHITERTIEGLAAESRTRQRGSGGATIWDRAQRFLELRARPDWLTSDDPAVLLSNIFATEMWITPEYEDAEPARLDMQLLLDKAQGLLAEHEDRARQESVVERLRSVAQRLRYQIATREPFAAAGAPDVHVATFWGAKGVTAEHVYILGVCDEAIPGQRREEYPGTDAEFIEEQRRLFYVSITRSRQTLVISRATSAATAEAMRMGLAIEPTGSRVGLQMSRFLRDIMGLLPQAVPGRSWAGCD
jgi:superfamily I DNA/RNA helicase